MIITYEITCENKTFNLVYDSDIPVPKGKYKEPYIFFCENNRKIIKEVFGNELTFGETARILKFCWLNISDEFKNNFNI